MKNKKKLGLLLLSLMIYGISFGQEEEVDAAASNTSFDLGVDFASRYVWRGLEFSDSPAMQPYAEMTSGNFTLGIWASYETGGQVVGQEFDFYASYSFGAVSLGFTDYSFPVDGASDGYFMMKNHIGEAMFSFDGVESFPVTFMLGVNVYNDDGNSVYTELGAPFTIGGTEMSAFIGGGNEIYSMDGDFAVTNFGISASKDIAITDSFSLGATASAIFNPDTDDAYLVFLISL